MTEYDFIRSITGKFQRDPQQHNALFESDAELIDIAGQTWAFTMDEFTPEEDLFTSDDPRQLGVNLVTATISDLLATGADPRFFMHTLALPTHADPAFAEQLTDGISATLEAARCFLIGGDIATCPTWRYTGFAAGPVAVLNPIMRRFGPASRQLWITGPVGDANVAALTHAPTPPLELRIPEATLIRPFATGGIDTSGGLMDALWCLLSVNPAWRIDLQCEKIPLADSVKIFAASTGASAYSAIVGGAGEYELLFATPALSDEQTHMLQSKGFTMIAEVSHSQKPGIFAHWESGPHRQILQAPPCPRSYPDLEPYIAAVQHYTQQNLAKP